MSDRPYFRAAGVVVGLLSGIFLKIRKAARPYAQSAIVIVLTIFALPSIVEYWLKRTRIPDVPISAIVLLLAGSFFLLAFAAAIYTVCQCLLQMQSTERATGVIQARRRRQSEPTEGSFTPSNEAAAWQREQIDDLRRQGMPTDSINLLAKNGVLTEDDRKAVEEMAETAALRARGRTV